MVFSSLFRSPRVWGQSPLWRPPGWRLRALSLLPSPTLSAPRPLLCPARMVSLTHHGAAWGPWRILEATAVETLLGLLAILFINYLSRYSCVRHRGARSVPSLCPPRSEYLSYTVSKKMPVSRSCCAEAPKEAAPVGLVGPLPPPVVVGVSRPGGENC